MRKRAPAELSSLAEVQEPLLLIQMEEKEKERGKESRKKTLHRSVHFYHLLSMKVKAGR